MEKANKIKDLLKSMFKEPLDETSLMFYRDTLNIRSSDVVSQIEQLKYDCMEPDSAHSHLLLGHRGCGKSTELNKLMQDLKAENYLVYKIKCIEEIDIYNIDKNDILLLISNALIEIANTNNIPVPDTLSKKIAAFFLEIENFIEESKQHEFSIGAGMEAKTSAFLAPILKVFVKAKGDIKYGTSQKTKIRENLQNKVGDWLLNIYELKDIIYHHTSKLPILLFEDIDKIPNPQDALHIFNNSILSNLQFPVIFTFPISIAFSKDFTPVRNQYKVHFLPMIKTHDKDNNDYSEGINIIKDIIYARAENNLFEDEAITLLIKKTGGILRDVFECINKAAFRAYKRLSDVIETADIERALLELKSDYVRIIIVDDYNRLYNIHDTKREIEDKDEMLEYLQSQIVLEYNGEHWFDVHPLVFEFVDERIKARKS
jgi:GTPase SAR1 family protein